MLGEEEEEEEVVTQVSLRFDDLQPGGRLSDHVSTFSLKLSNKMNFSGYDQ